MVEKNEYTMEEILAEMIEEGRSEKAILNGNRMCGYNVQILKFQLPTPSDGPLLCYNEDQTILRFFDQKIAKEIVDDMKERELEKAYYWGIYLNKELYVYTRLPCEQNRDW